MKTYESWARYPKIRNQQILRADSPSSALVLPTDGRSVLPYGLGRSYGDSCINNDNAIIETSALSCLISFDEKSGVLKAEAGVSLAAILDVFVPRGWFLPVTPGTKFVTLGGAVANDIHGKNHHKSGTFGCHVKSLGLRRSDGSYLTCSLNENELLFRATIGGLGLTGLITWVEFQLIPIASPYLDTRTVKFRNLDEFFDVSAENDSLYDYNVSWVDCTSEGASLGRGLFMAGNFSQRTKNKSRFAPALPFPCDAPAWLLNSYLMRSFNTVYYNKQLSRTVDALTHYDPFFYPLDAILNWNKMYGRRGFFQYQLIVPFDHDRSIIKEIFIRITRSKRASFLAVLKTFGAIESPGLISFPTKGVTLALDFPNDGIATLNLMNELDQIVRESKGRIYPAKDARMSQAMFEISHPRLNEFKALIDPRFSSSLWRRVMETT